MNEIKKEAFQGHPWYPAIEEFLEKGFCDVTNEHYPVVMAALERLGFESEVAKGSTDATTRLYGSSFPFPKEKEHSEVEMSVPENTLQQLGGREFVTMTGSRNFVADGNTLRMRLAKNQSGANFLEITLNGRDLYDMRFFYYKNGYLKTLYEQQKLVEVPPVRREVMRYDDVYCDMLRSLFTQVTGLDTYMPRFVSNR